MFINTNINRWAITGEGAAEPIDRGGEVIPSSPSRDRNERTSSKSPPGVWKKSEELDRIRAKVQQTPETDADARRRYLKALSDERVRHWPNTLEAQRKNKENWKKRQEENIEGKRREIDRAEAMLQRRLRTETIRRANDRLYEQTDKMKLLQGNLLFAEVIETRKAQIEENEERRKAEQKIAEAYHLDLMRKVVEGERREQEISLAKAEKERVIAAAQQEQLKDFQEKYIAAFVKEKEEGDASQRAAKAAIEAEEEALERRKIKARQEMEAMLAANRSLREIRAKALSEEQKYIDKCAQQQDALDRAARARRALEKKRFNEHQEARQKIIDRAAKELEARYVSVDEKAEREATEQRRKEDEVAAKKKAAQDKEKEDIEISRAKQIEFMGEREKQQKEENGRIREYFERSTKEMTRHEVNEGAARVTREKDLRASQRVQALERRERELAEQAFENVNHEHMVVTHKEEEDRFKKIIKGHMDDFEARGQSTYLLKRTLHHKKPEMFPASSLKQ